MFSAAPRALRDLEHFRRTNSDDIKKQPFLFFKRQIMRNFSPPTPQTRASSRRGTGRKCPSLPALVRNLRPKWALLRRPSPPPSAFSPRATPSYPQNRAQAAPTPVASESRDLPGGAASSVTPSAAGRYPISRWRGLRQTSIVCSRFSGALCLLPVAPPAQCFSSVRRIPRLPGATAKM